ncbi:YesL family protein [Alkalibacterium iburiense]|uniref:YesL family protein n=1 Tax=Alkalibacterium iburiense TaxID=290589 RepID=A0ABN0XEK4_9LACT
MNKKDIIEKVYTFCEWVMFLSLLNFLWLLFTLAGVVLLGWAPATAASYAVLNKVYEEKTIKIAAFKTFWTEYKTYFLSANYLGYSILGVSAFMIFGMITLPTLPTALFFVLAVFYGAVVSMFLVTSLYIFPVLVRKNGSYTETIKTSLFMGTAHLNHIIKMIPLLFISYILFMGFPGTMIFLLISLPIFIISKQTTQSFEGIEQKSKKDVLVKGHET